MPEQIQMPQQSDTMTEGTVVKWVKREGDPVKSGEIVAEIETDKAVMEIESFATGTLAHVAVPEGSKVPVGAVLAVVATAKENAADVKKQFAGGAGAAKQEAPKAEAAKPEAAKPQAATAAQPQAAQPAAAAPSQAGGTAKPARVQQESANSAPSGMSVAGGGAVTLEAASMSEIHEPANVGHGATREPATAVPAISTGNGNGRRIVASPLAKRIAADKGVDLKQIFGSGPGGRIVQADVLQAAERQAAAPPAAPAAAPAGAKPAPQPEPERVARGETVAIPNTKMRTAIATALQRSKQQVPHFYLTVDVDVEELSQLRGRLNKQLERAGVKVSVNDFVTKAVAAALVKHPGLNAHWKDDAITRFGDVHLGIAVAIPDGLIVPVLRNADQLGLRELQQRTGELAKKAKAQKLRGEEMKGATFTISNLGMFGIKDFNAIINPPEVAILAVATAEKRAVVRGEQVVARTMMSLTLSVDHRAVDGATAAEFMRTLKGLLEEPGMMLV